MKLSAFEVLFDVIVFLVTVEQLKERRDKLRERLNNGPHKIIQEHLSKARGMCVIL